MHTSLFLQSEVANPFQVYSRMLHEQPVCWDPVHQVWAIYSYQDCHFLLHTPTAHIPEQDSTVREKMGAYAARVAERLARLSNPPQHGLLKQVAIGLFEKMERVDIPGLLASLLGTSGGWQELDWVQTVARPLPVLSVLKGFGFSTQDMAVILPQVEKLTKIVAPHPTDQQIVAVKEAIALVYPLVEQHLLKKKSLRMLIDEHAADAGNYEETVLLYVSNLIGLLIQSCDAGRGALSNALIQLLTHARPGEVNPQDSTFFRKSVIEALRYDPPVHHTRRILTGNVLLDNKELKKDEAVVLVLAAANRDSGKFESANEYAIFRSNNTDFLTFGAGSHQCLAKHFTVQLVTETLQALFVRYSRIRIQDVAITYEPVANVRLPTRITLAVS